MLRYIHLKNFRSLTDFKFDFTGKNGKPKNLILLYGENGSGKSNFVSAFNMFLAVYKAFGIRRLLSEILDEELKSSSQEKIRAFRNYLDISRIINNYKTVESKGNMSIELGFLLDGKKGTYYIEFDNEQIVKECLDYTLNSNKGNYFSISKNSEYHINPNLFSGLYLNELYFQIDKYWGKYSLLSIIDDANEEFSKEFADKAVDEKLKSVLEFFKKISTYAVSSETDSQRTYRINNRFLNLDSGKISSERMGELHENEKIIEYYFSRLYKDIKNVYYKLKKQEDDSILYTLVFRKMISGSIIDVDYTNESFGTLKLLSFLPYLIHTISGNISILDEIGNGIHDILFLNIIKNLFHELVTSDGQLIITTHNTLFLSEYDLKDCIYFIEMDDNSHRSIKAITDFDFRIQRGSNTIINYLNGKFSRLPWQEVDIDFSKIKQ